MLTCITIAIVLAIYFIIEFINYAEKRIFNRLYSDLFDRIKHYMEQYYYLSLFLKALINLST